jgi:hypothetical protein
VICKSVQSSFIGWGKGCDEGNGDGFGEGIPKGLADGSKEGLSDPQLLLRASKYDNNGALAAHWKQILPPQATKPRYGSTVEDDKL